MVRRFFILSGNVGIREFYVIPVYPDAGRKKRSEISKVTTPGKLGKWLANKTKERYASGKKRYWDNKPRSRETKEKISKSVKEYWRKIKNVNGGENDEGNKTEGWEK